MKGPKTYDEYVDLVHNAVYEVDEMRAGIEYDPENAERWSNMLDHLDGVLRNLYDQMVADTYEFPTGKDLQYMQFVNRWGREIPFKQLLVVITKRTRTVCPVGKIIFAVVFTIVLVLWFKYMGSRRGPTGKPPKTPEAEDMVRCRVCGVNMPRSEAIKVQGQYYCCDEHRRSGR